MAVKVTFDVNFLDKFDAADQATRESVFLCIDLGHLEFFASDEMLKELMGMALSARKEKIIPYSGHVLRLMQGKILSVMLAAQESELRGAFQLLVADEARDQVVRFLEQAAGGHVPSAAAGIGQEAINLKTQVKSWTDRWYEGIVQRANKMTPEKRRAATYKDLQQRHWENTGRETVIRSCAEFGIPDGEALADRVMANPTAYPHVRFPGRIFAVMLHRYFVEQAKRDAGDLFDLWQMSYLVDMDVFITNEKKLSGWYMDVFGPAKQVLTAEEFLARAWC